MSEDPSHSRLVAVAWPQHLQRKLPSLNRVASVCLLPSVFAQETTGVSEPAVAKAVFRTPLMPFEINGFLPVMQVDR